jgi:hypothetical protein
VSLIPGVDGNGAEQANIATGLDRVPRPRTPGVGGVS